MRKRWILCCLTLAFLLALGGCALAQEESQQTALMAGELKEWAKEYLERAMEGELLNDPTAPEAKSEDGYAFIYDFATLYLDGPELDQDSQMNAVVITTDNGADPRGIKVDDSLDALLNAYYSENPTLVGDENFAALYISDMMPETALWAWVQRDGQRVTQVQYAVHDQIASGGSGYTDCGLSFTIQDGFVAAIRAYGLSAQITKEQVEDNLDEVNQVMGYASYFQYPASMLGTDLEPFQQSDLVFSGLDFLHMTPDQTEELMGSVEYEDWMEDGGNFLQTITAENGAVTFLLNGSKEPLYVDTLNINGPGMEGPRGVRVGDSLSSVIMRFRHSEGEYDGGSREVLYGDGETAPFGTAEYGNDASATLRYALSLDNGQTVTLYLEFQWNQLTEIMLYRW